MPVFRTLQDNSLNMGAQCLVFSYLTVKILAIVRKNRAKHKMEYDATVVAYKKAMVAHTTRMSEMAMAGKDVSLRLGGAPQKPKHYLEDYDHVIQMLTLTTQKSIQLDPKTFAQLVLNDWEWSQSFYGLTASYAGYINPPSYPGTGDPEIGDDALGT